MVASARNSRRSISPALASAAQVLSVFLESRLKFVLSVARFMDLLPRIGASVEF